MNSKSDRYDMIEKIREAVVKFAEDYWDNGGLYNDGDLDDIIDMVENLPPRRNPAKRARTIAA